MLDKKISENLLHRSREVGSDFCDIFVERTRRQHLRVNSRQVKETTSGTSFGIGIRLIYGTEVLYGYTNSTHEKDLMEIINTLGARYQGRSATSNLHLDFSKEATHRYIAAMATGEISMDEQVRWLKQLDDKVRLQGQLIEQVDLTLAYKKQEVEIFTSEGLWTKEERPYIRLMANAIGVDGNLRESSYHAPGARAGLSYIHQMDQEYIANYLGHSVSTLLKAKPCPAGSFPVVIDSDFGGVIFHEACGHSLETTSVEKKASVFWDKKGEMIANEAVSAVDDGTIDNMWGSLSIDDEGMETQRTQLIKNGKLENFLCDRVGHLKTGHPRTGSGRRESYKFAPASRMRNTFIEPGKSSKEEMLSTIKDGIYAKSMGGGSVNPGTGQFNFAIKEGYLIKDGKILDAVKGATLIGKGEEILKRISMVSDNIELVAGMCGSVSGSIPTTVGQPAIKVDEILVGGQ